MIIWKGRGVLSILVLVVCLAITLLIMPDGKEDYAFVISLFVAACFSWYFGARWNNQDSIITLNPKTGQMTLLKNHHTLFWIKMQYWGLIFSILGIIILAQNSLLASLIVFVILIAIVFTIYMANRKDESGARNGKMVADKKQTAEELRELERKIVVAEEERLKRRQEKEDPRRFMPGNNN